MNQRVTRVGPGIEWRRTAARGRSLPGGDANPEVGAEFHGTSRAFDEYEHLRKAVVFDAARVAEVARHRRATLHLEEDGGDVFALDIRMNALRQTVEPGGLAEQESCDIQNMTA